MKRQRVPTTLQGGDEQDSSVAGAPAAAPTQTPRLPPLIIRALLRKWWGLAFAVGISIATTILLIPLSKPPDHWWQGVQDQYGVLLAAVQAYPLQSLATGAMIGLVTILAYFANRRELAMEHEVERAKTVAGVSGAVVHDLTPPLERLESGHDAILEGQQGLQKGQEDLLEGQDRLESGQRTLIKGQVQIVAAIEEVARAPMRHPLIAVRDLDRSKFNLGDDNAVAFPYRRGFVQAAFEQAATVLTHASEGRPGKHGIVVTGVASSGKTRLALEALTETLPGWLVLKWNEAYSTADLPPQGALPDSGFILFIDDLQNYVPMTQIQQHGSDGQVAVLLSNPAATLRALLDAITVKPCIIVATCRAEDEERTHAELGWLFNQLEPIRLPVFSVNDTDAEALRIKAEFDAHGSKYISDWDGTLGSLVLGLSTKHVMYESLKGRMKPAADILKAMKLLWLAEVVEHTERRLRAVCADVFAQPSLASNGSAWRDAVDELLRLQFVRKETNDVSHDVTLVISKDVYFERVVVDYPHTTNDPGQLDRDLSTLQATLVQLEDAAGLFALGGAFYARQHPAEALAAYEQALTLAPLRANAWYNKGVALGVLGRPAEALAAFEQALTLAPEQANAWTNKGAALSVLGRPSEALAAYERALQLRPEDADTWHNKGRVLSDLGRPAEALVAFEQALRLAP